MRFAALLTFLTATTLLAAPPKPAVTWDESPNRTGSSRETSYDIDTIVIHTTEGKDTNGDGVFTECYTQAISWFNNPAAGVSAHYVISPSGAVTQMVADDDIAWHATYYNSRSIGIECAGFSSKAGTWTPALLETLSSLVAYLCDAYDITAVHPAGNAYDEPGDKFTKTGLVGHAQIQPWSRSDPGAYFPWAAFVEAVNEKLDVAPPPAPVLLSPVAGATVPAGAVFFDWSTVPTADDYQLKVFTPAGALVHTSWPKSSSGSATLAAGSYVWHVWSHNGAGYSSTSASSTLTVVAPPAPPGPGGIDASVSGKRLERAGDVRQAGLGPDPGGGGVSGEPGVQGRDALEDLLRLGDDGEFEDGLADDDEEVVPVAGAGPDRCRGVGDLVRVGGVLLQESDQELSCRGNRADGVDAGPGPVYHCE